MRWFARTHANWVPKFLGACILLWGISIVASAEARGRNEEVPYVPEIIEVEQSHAWCYVLKNVQNKLVGNINILACVPKGTPERNPDRLSLEEPDGD